MNSIQSILEEFFEVYLVSSLPLDYMASYLKSLALVLADRSNVCIRKEVLATISICDSKCSFLASLLSFCCDFHFEKKKKSIG